MKNTAGRCEKMGAENAQKRKASAAAAAADDSVTAARPSIHSRPNSV